MKKILLLLCLFAGCKKDEVVQPTATKQQVEYANWTIKFDGSDSTQFSVVFFSSTPPYVYVPYSGTVSKTPIEVKMVVGQTYTIQYRDTDNVVKYISHAPKDTTKFIDTIPATTL